MRRVPGFVLVTVGLGAAGAASAQGFGSAAAVADRDVFVSSALADGASGTVYLFRMDARGRWVETRQLKAEPVQPDRFGRSLSASGNRLLIGGTTADSSRGAAWIFEKDRSGAWHQVVKLIPTGVQPGDNYGRAVALAGEVAYVAAWGRNEGRGAVTIWRRLADGRWSEEATLSASDGMPNDFFGSSIAPDGNRVLVGALQKDSAAGAAYIFRRDPATGQWTEETRLQVRPPRSSAFGGSALLKGGEALVGAPGLDGGIGAVMVFVRDSASGRWVEQRRLAAFDGMRQGQFGGGLAMVEGEVWVASAGVEGRQGRIYRFSRDAAGGWTGVAKLGHPDLERGDGFGGSLAVSGATAVVGLPGDDFGAGTAVVLTRGNAGWTPGDKFWSETKGFDAIVGGKRDCTGGQVQAFSCNGVDLLSYLPVKALGGARGVMTSGNWGWTDPQTGREYALIGLMDRTSFVDVTDPLHPVVLGSLPLHAGATPSIWREIKTYKSHAYIVSDGSGPHGLQVFDLTRLRGVRNPPVAFTEDAHYDRVASVHNIVIDTTAGFAFAVGTSSGGETCGGALHMIDIRDPKKPAFAGCFADPSTGYRRTGYVHDAQCLVYHGPDSTYHGRHICFNSSETALGIADVTDKANPKVISKLAYPNVAYAHQGWITDDWRYFYLDDEGDEGSGTVPGTRTLIFDVSDLDEPVVAAEYIATTKSTDHNQYVVGNLLFQSNYQSGLRILDITNRTKPVEVGFFDTVPGPETSAQMGSWNNYPFFKSGTIVVNSMQEGVFFVKKSDRALIP